MRVVLFVLCLVTAACSRAEPPSPTQPSAELSPRAVVATVLGALQENNKPRADAGIATAFAFASPGNRAQTGPLPRFTDMVHTGYAALLNHRNATIGEPVADGQRLVFPVQVVPRDGAVRLYLFVLAQQEGGDCGGCWVTDGVIDQTDQAPERITT